MFYLRGAAKKPLMVSAVLFFGLLLVPASAWGQHVISSTGLLQLNAGLFGSAMDENSKTEGSMESLHQVEIEGGLILFSPYVYTSLNAGIIASAPISGGIELDGSDVEMEGGYRAVIHLGYSMWDRYLIVAPAEVYVRAGYGTRDLEYQGDEEEISGLVYGAGLSVSPSDTRVQWQVEVMRHEYGETSFNDTDIELTEHSARIGVGIMLH